MARWIFLLAFACGSRPTAPPSNVAPPAQADAAKKYTCFLDTCTDTDMCEMWRGNAALEEPNPAPCVPVAIVYCHESTDDCFRTRPGCEVGKHVCVERR